MASGYIQVRADDTLVWRRAKNGFYAVPSFYKKLVGVGMCPTPSRVAPSVLVIKLQFPSS